MRVLIAVTHLLGAGHLTRAAALARALAVAGHEAVLVSGGAPAALVRLDGVRFVQLPPLHVRGTDFGRLLDESGAEADAGLLARRSRMLLAVLEETAPDVVVTELFPFGRRGLTAEFLNLFEAARTGKPRPLMIASVRDVLVAPDKAAKVVQARDRIARSYDGVLVHGDPALLPLDASWPVDESLRPMLRYTGYVDEGGSGFASTERSGIVAAAGSSAAGLGLLHAAAEAGRRRPDLGWRILAGHGVAEADFAALGHGLADGVLTRAQSDYRARLARSALSVSQCGYNTAVDLLATGTPAVLVPFEAGHETEQRLRADTLAARGLARVLPERDLTADALLEAVALSLAAPPPVPHGIDLNGAVRSVAIIEEMVGSSSRHRSRGQIRFDRLRAALDAVAERGISVPVWWRDDDAVAATPALDRLLGLAQEHAAPILVAVIPAAVESSLGERIDRAPGAWLSVHGLAHANHAPAGEKPSEFGPHRPFPALLRDAADALRLARERLPEERLLPVFVPPWNRLSPELAEALPGLGYAGLSAAPGPPVAGLVRADVRFDPVDWRGTRSLADPDALLDGLARAIAEGAGRPLGLLTHHLAHDEAVWGFLADLLPVLFAHPAVAVLDPAELFRPAVDAVSSAWSVSPPERLREDGVTPLLSIRDLAVEFRADGPVFTALHGLSLDVMPGRTLALVGESGSGKSVTAQSILRILPRSARIARGQILFDEGAGATDIAVLAPNGPEIRCLRGQRIAMIFQEPMTCLSPLHSIGDQIGEALRVHTGADRREADVRTMEALARVGFPDPQRALKTYPFELSGGLRQRAMIAMALILKPALLVADEPTTALDVTTQAQILALLARLQAETGMAILLITHDLGVVANLAHDMAVLYRGRLVEAGPREVVMRRPGHAYLQALLRAVPRFDMAPGERLTPIRPARAEIPSVRRHAAPEGPMLRVEGLEKSFTLRAGRFGRTARRVRAVSDVSLTLPAGSTLGLVGESGSGKTTVSRMVMRALTPDAGRVLFDDGSRARDVHALEGADLFAYRRQVQFVFQDPYGSLDPRMTVRQVLSEPMEIHGIDAPARKQRARELVAMVGLEPDALGRYPHAFSGGQRQRIGIARALALEPRLLVLDEPVSALDVSVQAQILNLLKDLQAALGLTYLIVSHNLAVIDYMADVISVMCRGRIVEEAPRGVLFRAPAHPYTQALLAAVPDPSLDHPLDFSAVSGLHSDPARWPEPYRLGPDEAGVMETLTPGHRVRLAAAHAREAA